MVDDTRWDGPLQKEMVTSPRRAGHVDELFECQSWRDTGPRLRLSREDIGTRHCKDVHSSDGDGCGY